MKKLTKAINRKRKNYKPTVGIVYKGRQMSVNSEVYYAELEKEKQAKAKREARKFISDFIAEQCPGIKHLFDAFASMDGFGWYF